MEKNIIRPGVSSVSYKKQNYSTIGTHTDIGGRKSDDGDGDAGGMAHPALPLPAPNNLLVIFRRTSNKIVAVFASLAFFWFSFNFYEPSLKASVVRA